LLVSGEEVSCTIVDACPQYQRVFRDYRGGHHDFTFRYRKDGYTDIKCELGTYTQTTRKICNSLLLGYIKSSGISQDDVEASIFASDTI